MFQRIVLFAVCSFTLMSNFYYWNKLKRSSDDYESTTRTKPFFHPKHEYSCRMLFNKNANTENVKVKRKLRTEVESWQLFGDCEQLFRFHYYPKYPFNEEESQFPLAYVILVNQHLEHLELLLNAIYAPQNVYCIHVDFKASRLIHEAVARLSSCFTNVFSTTQPIRVSRVDIGAILAQRLCHRELLYSAKWTGIHWKYVIHLQGHDFPLKTNGEIVRGLKMMDGSNDIELSEASFERLIRHFSPIHDYLGFILEFDLTDQVKTAPPHNLTIYKGNVGASLTRETVRAALDSKIAENLLNWLNDTYMPDEHFWSTLVHNDEIVNLPGSYPGRCLNKTNKTWISRFAVWEWNVPPEQCKGTFRNSVCLFSVEDLNMLTVRRELFLNKFWLPTDSLALDCMHELLFNRTYIVGQSTDMSRSKLEFYTNLHSVKFERWKKAKKDPSAFICT